MKICALVWLAVVGLLLLAIVPGVAAEHTAVGRVSVVDGDTIELHGERIRLAAIDAPESRQTCRRGGDVWPCGRRAAFALADHVGNRTVTCRWTERDRYRRPVATCRVGKGDLGAWLVEQGWALAYRRYGMQYVTAEDRARGARRGLWSGSFVPPWAWRRGNGAEVSATAWRGA